MGASINDVNPDVGGWLCMTNKVEGCIKHHDTGEGGREKSSEIAGRHE